VKQAVNEVDRERVANAKSLPVEPVNDNRVFYDSGSLKEKNRSVPSPTQQHRRHSPHPIRREDSQKKLSPTVQPNGLIKQGSSLSNQDANGTWKSIRGIFVSTNIARPEDVVM
jgi:hypothetical protein